MNNYCWYCGKKIEKNTNNCPHCEAKIITERVNVEERIKLNQEQKTKENKLFFSTLALIISLNLISPLIPILNPIIMIGSFIYLVQLSIKHQYSKKIKYLAIIYSIMQLLYIILIIWLMATCGIIHNGY